MDDLTATRLCYEAMGDLPAVVEHEGEIRFGYRNCLGPAYAPLHDDAQAMALVKRFNVICSRWIKERPGIDESWAAFTDDYSGTVANADLNHCIVYCIAAQQQARRDAE